MELGPSITQIERDQILDNLSRFIDSCRADTGCNLVPNQFVLGAGQAQVSNQQQTPNLTASLTKVAIKALSFQDQNQWTQSWSITPVTDFADLERLRALYRYAISLGDKNPYDCETFSKDYNRQLVKAVDPTGQVPLMLMKSAPSDTSAGDKLSLHVDSVLSADSTPPILTLPLPLPKVTEKGSIALCGQTWLHALPAAKWVYWDEQITPGVKPLGSYGKHKIYVDEGKLQDFMIWVFGATPNTASGGSKTGGQKPGAMAMQSGVF